MVQSMFCAAPYISKDVIITYADIIFNPHIIDKMITINKDHIPLNENWLNFWKQRMPIKEITKDAENIEIEKKYIKTIGKKIINNYPRGQYMGLIRLKKNLL